MSPGAHRRVANLIRRSMSHAFVGSYSPDHAEAVEKDFVRTVARFEKWITGLEDRAQGHDKMTEVKKGRGNV